MRIIFLLLFTFILGVSYAQEPVYNQMRNNYQFKGIRVDSLLLIPKFSDTSSANATKLDSIHGNLIRVNTKFYYRDTLVKKWFEFGAGGGGSTDTTSLSNRINAKADTSALNGVVYFTDTLTTIATISDIKGDSPDRINGKATANVTANMANKMLIIDTVSIFNARSYLGDSSALLSVTGGGVNLTASEVSSGYLSGISVTPKDARIGSSSYFNVQNNQDTMYFKWGSGGKIYVPLIGGTDTVALVSQLSSIDTTSLSNRINDKIDSLKKSTDSVYFKKNGTWYYSFKDSSGGGGQNGRFGNDTATILMAKVHNDAGSTLTNGEVVYLSTSGANADAPSVRRAVNKGDSASANTFGFVHGTINTNDTGWIVLYGKIEKLNTSAFANGDVIYLDSIPGKWTKSKPKAPYHLVYLGAVIKSNAGNGSIFAKVQNGYEVSEIHDIQINDVTNNQVLLYSDTQKIWKNRDVYTVVDTTQLSARIDQRVKYSDTSVFLRDSDSSLYQTKFRSDTMRTNVYNELNNKQSSTLNSYSLIANNTNASAIGAAQNFKDSSGTYSGTITFSGTAPSGTTNHTFRYTQIGKMCILNINLSYTTAASCLSVTLSLPSFCAAPANPGGLGANNEFIYPGYGMTWSTKSIPTGTGLNSARTAWLRRNSSGNPEMVIFNYSSGSTIFLSGTVIYWTN